MQLADLHRKKIIVGITGGIAAYKTLTLIRFLIRSGAEVQVIMTAAATEFITPLTASTLSKRPVIHQLTTGSGGEVWNNHVEWGLWADLMVIAPATANTLFKMAHGHSDNVLMATYLSARCPVMVAPAMDADMWDHPSTQRNLEVLRNDGVEILPTDHGELASGLIGPGRMAEPEVILYRIEKSVTHRSPVLENLHVLVTAGPTYESLDPVRFIGNWSSGKMGIAIAEQLHLQGAKVTLIQGPGTQSTRFPELETIRVRSAQEMYAACLNIWNDCQVGIFAAAVADYRPAEYSKQKMAKSDADMAIRLERTPDIAASLGTQKRNNQMIIGFAMETQNEIANAKSKLHKKNMDMIVLNSLLDEGSGFGTDTNKVTFITKNGAPETQPLKSKMEVAKDIVTYIVNNFKL